MQHGQGKNNKMELLFDLMDPQENAHSTVPPMKTEKWSVAVLARSYHCRERLDSHWQQLRWGVGLGQAENFRRISDICSHLKTPRKNNVQNFASWLGRT